MIISTGLLAQSWNFVGPQSFTPAGCHTVKIAQSGVQGINIVTDPFSTTASSRYLHPYHFDGTVWQTIGDSIVHTAFITYDLNPDIEENSTNQFFILSNAGPNKSYLFEQNLGMGSWDLVDSIGFDHTDLEPLNAGGDLFMSAYSGVFQHNYGTGSNTAMTYPGLMSFPRMTTDNSNVPYVYHATSSYGYLVSEYNSSYTTLDSINYGAYTVGDIETSQNLPVYVHLDTYNGDKVLISKYNGASWDTLYINSPTTYEFDKINFNLGIDAATGDIYVGVASSVYQTSPTVQTTTQIEVFKVAADLNSYTNLGQVANWTNGGNNAPNDFDVEFILGKCHVGYVDFQDSAKVSVKSFDMTSSTDNVTTIETHVYPNPTTGNITINFNEENISLELIDITGRIVYQEKNFISGSQLDLSNSNNGIYFIKLNSETGYEHSEKIVLRK